MAIKVSKNDIQIDLQSGTSRTLYATWKWTKSNTKEYSVVWQFDTGDGVWFDGNSSTTSHKNSTYNIPDNAKKVRVKIKPISKTYKKNKKNTYYWTAEWSSYVSFNMAKVSPIVPSTEKTVRNLAIQHQNGTDRTVYASWSWDENHTDHYEYQWWYATGNGIWFEGTTGASNAKNCLYSIPDNATKARIRVKPISGTHVVNAQDTNYWIASWSEYKLFDASQLETIIPETDTTVKNLAIDVQNNTGNTLFCKWSWGKSNTDGYEVEWQYATGNNTWFAGETTTVTLKNSTYSPPDNSKKIRVRVKPISENWTANYSSWVTFDMSNVPPSSLSAPNVEINKFTLKADINVYKNTAKEVEFYVVKNDTKKFASGIAPIIKNHSSYEVTVAAGDEYKVRCRAKRDDEYSSWSEYSSNVGTIPMAPGAWNSIKAISDTEVFLDWPYVRNAEEYIVQYTKDKKYFDSSPNNVNETSITSVVDGNSISHAEITGLESGSTYYFRVRASNSQGSSAWGPIGSLIIGKKPASPTTWSLKSVASIGEIIVLYWTHNSLDGSNETTAKIHLTVNGVSSELIVQRPSSLNSDNISSYVIDTGEYVEDTTIKWKVATKGVIDDYSDWSVEREIKVHASPSIALGIYKNNNWYWDSFNFETDSIYSAKGECDTLVETLTSFPFYVEAEAFPKSQSAIRFFISIIANESYEIKDNIGRTISVKAGDVIFSNHYDADDNKIVALFMAGDINLQNNQSYTVLCSVSMDSGLTAEANQTFIVVLDDDDIEPNAEISIDLDTLSAYITPYAIKVDDENEERLSNVLLSIYRRQYNGEFIEIASGLHGINNSTITDPHPALDFAIYRIVAISIDTGRVYYSDLPGVPIDESALIIQWDEEWSSFDVSEEEEFVEQPWNGSMLKLPWNIDISDNFDPDVSMIKYIGRKYPVTYYGTQKGHTSTWNFDIDKNDEETLYQIRRLAEYSGDCYVREPSGSGYWANVKVSYSSTHNELIIPVNLSVTRVEGGI